MVVLLTNRKNKVENEIIEILTKYGANYISDKIIAENENKFTVISEYKATTLNLNKGIAVMLDNSDRFINQTFPTKFIGICEDSNTKALKIFKKSNISVISCGMNNKNTVTITSFNSNILLASLQRTIINCQGKEIEPAEYKIKLTKNYSPLAVMVSASILLLNGILPLEF